MRNRCAFLCGCITTIVAGRLASTARPPIRIGAAVAQTGYAAPRKPRFSTPPWSQR